MAQDFDDVLRSIELPPVLVDVGASGGSKKDWDRLAPVSTYVGFDPDDRDFSEATGSQFRQRHLIRKAVTPRDETSVSFHLTASPHCSSTLEPDFASLSPFVFIDRFRVEKIIEVPAVTLNRALCELSLDRIDWLKIDAQGADLPIYQSVAPKLRDRILAVDMEFGFVPGYKGEFVFSEAHAVPASEGFWLSRLRERGVARITKKATDVIVSQFPALTMEVIGRNLRQSPCWAEPRYLRTIDWVRAHGQPRRDFVVLWAFAMIDEQYGFAIEVAQAYHTDFGDDEIGAAMIAEPAQRLRAAATPKSPAKRIIRRIRKVISR